MTQEEPVSVPMITPAVTKAPVVDGPLPDTITADTATTTITTTITSTSPRVLKRPSTEDLPQTPKKQKTTGPAKSTPAMPAKILTPFSPGEKSSPNLRIRRLSTKARIPKRGSALAAGYDLYRCVLVFPFVMCGCVDG